MKSKFIATMARALLGASLVIAGSAVAIEVAAVTSPAAGAATASQVLMTSTQNAGGVGAQCFANGAAGVTFTPPVGGGVTAPVNANSTNGFPNNGAVTTGTAPILTVCWRGPDEAVPAPDNICWVVQVWPSNYGVGRVPARGGYNAAGTCTVPVAAPIAANAGPTVLKIGQAGAAGVDVNFDNVGPFNGVSYRAGVKECIFGPGPAPVRGAACPAVLPAPTMVASVAIMPRAAPNQLIIPAASYQHTSLQHFVVGLGLVKIMYVWFNPSLVNQGFSDTQCSSVGPQCQWEGPPSERYYQGQVTLGAGGAALFNQAVQIYRVNSARWVATFQCTAGQQYVMKFAPEIRTTATYPGGPAIPVQILAGQTTTSGNMGC